MSRVGTVASFKDAAYNLVARGLVEPHGPSQAKPLTHAPLYTKAVLLCAAAVLCQEMGLSQVLLRDLCPAPHRN